MFKYIFLSLNYIFEFKQFFYFIGEGFLIENIFFEWNNIFDSIMQKQKERQLKHILVVKLIIYCC